MVQVISKGDLDFYLLPQEVCCDFVAKDTHELSDMESFLLKLIGDVIRPKESEHFWANGYYCWFINDNNCCNHFAIFHCHVPRFCSRIFKWNEAKTDYNHCN